MWRDLRQAAAGLWRSPAFTLTAVAALGLAIGANATIFGLIDGLWFRPAGIRDPARLVWIYATTPSGEKELWSYPEYEALRDRTKSFAGVVARGRRGTTMAADGSTELLLVNVVSPNFFTVLGIAPAAGRLFAPGDEAALERQPVIVLGHAFWRRRFGGDPAVVGRTVTLTRGTGVPVVVAGVLPETFRDLDADADRDIWMPPQTWMRLENRETFARRTDRWFDLLGMRAPSVSSVRYVKPEVDALMIQLAREFPDTNAGRGAWLTPQLFRRLENGGAKAGALLGLVLLVVLITCVNVANLLFARGVTRGRELALRAALGATRRRLIRHLFVESVLLGLAGALVGMTIALWLIKLIPSLLVPPPGFRSLTVFQADARVLAFTLVVTLLTTVLFGIAPSWLAARADAAPLLKGGGPGGSTRRDIGRVGQVLAVAQIAVSLVLLAGAATLARSFVEIRRADLGIASPQVLTAWVPGGDRAASRMPQTHVAIERLTALPGVTRVAVAFRAPLSLSGGGIAKPVILADRPLPPGTTAPSVKFNAVSRDYFAVLGVRLIAGRLFESADEGPAEPVAIVNQAFADRFFPGRSVLDARVRFGTESNSEHRIIGVVQNTAINVVTEPAEPYFYLSYWRGSYGEATFMLQTSSDAASLGPAVRSVLRGADPALEARRVVTMREYIDYSGSTYRATAALAVTLAGLGLILTVLGVYGVVAYRTARRASEIGVRMALGATRRDVLALVVREAAMAAAVGVAIGIPASIAGTREISGMLFNVSPVDARILAATATLLFVCVCLAAIVPAWRATRIEPFDALRTS